MRKIEVVLSDERLITPSGLCMVEQAMAKSDLIKKGARIRTDKRSQPQIKNGDILLTEIGMLTLGKTDFDYVNEFHKDEEYYKMSLGIAYGIPSESTLRMRLNAICEQFHSEIKTDMDIEQMPSGKFDTNALILKLGMIAYNVLRIIGTEAMKKNDMPIRHKTIRRRRIRTVIERLMLIAGHLTVHARKIILALGRSSPWANTFIRIWRVLSEG